MTTTPTENAVIIEWKVPEKHELCAKKYLIEVDSKVIETEFKRYLLTLIEPNQQYYGNAFAVDEIGQEGLPHQFGFHTAENCTYITDLTVPIFEINKHKYL